MPRGRPNKVGGLTKKEEANRKKEEANNALQVMAILKDLGFSKEEFVDLVTRAREDRGAAIEKERTTPEAGGTPANPNNQKSGERSWAQIVEEEEQSQIAKEAPVPQSWVEITRVNRDPQFGAPLQYVKPSEVITFSAAEIQEGAKMWNRSLIGMVVGSSPSYGEIVKYVRANWKEFGGCKIHQVRRGIFLFDFQTEEGKNQVLNEKWHIYNRFPLVLKPWMPGLDLEACFDSIPIWIQLPGLSLDLWAPKNLGKVVSYVGRPIMTDRNTARGERISYARVLVEVSVGGKLPESIPVRAEGGEIYQQKVTYEWVPVVCGKCGWFGHNSGQCRKEENKQRGGSEGQRNEIRKEKGEEGNPQQQQEKIQHVQNAGTSTGGSKQLTPLVGAGSGSKNVVDDEGFTLVTRKGSAQRNTSGGKGVQTVDGNMRAAGGTDRGGGSGMTTPVSHG